MEFNVQLQLAGLLEWMHQQMAVCHGKTAVIGISGGKELHRLGHGVQGGHTDAAGQIHRGLAGGRQRCRCITTACPWP